MDALISTYNRIMADLVSVPLGVDDAQAKLDQAKADQTDAKKVVDLRDAELQRMAEGKNADERKASLLGLKSTDRVYLAAEGKLREADFAVRDATAAFDSAVRRWTAVGYQAKLHSSLLGYLGSAGVASPNASADSVDSLGDVKFERPVDGKSNGRVNPSEGEAGPDDLDALGL